MADGTTGLFARKGSYSASIGTSEYGLEANSNEASARLAGSSGVEASYSSPNGPYAGLASSSVGVAGLFGNQTDYFAGQLGIADAGGYFERNGKSSTKLATIDLAGYFLKDGDSSLEVGATDYAAFARNIATNTMVTLAHDSMGLIVDGGVLPGLLSVSNSDTAVRAVTFATDPSRAAVEAWGNGAAPGQTRGAALKVRSGAVTVAGPGPWRFSGTIPVPGPWMPIETCGNLGGPPAHTHPMGYVCDVTLACDLILFGPPNVGSMITATVESDLSQPGQTVYTVQVVSKVDGSCTFRVGRLGSGPCIPPTEPVVLHYIIVNPDNAMDDRPTLPGPPAGLVAKQSQSRAYIELGRRERKP